MKTLLTVLVVAALSSCAKDIDVKLPEKRLSIDTFSSMLSKDKTYMVEAYYTTGSTLAVPVVNNEDTYTFDSTLNDGWISSKFPCIEYHYNYAVFASGDSILFDWLDFKITPQTFTLTDYKADEWFILKSGDNYVKYVRMND